MAIDVSLNALRRDYDAGVIDNDEFAAKANAVLDAITTSMTDAEKIAAFDEMAKSLRDNYQITDLEDGFQYVKSDIRDYIFEDFLVAIAGENIFDFYNATYEDG